MNTLEKNLNQSVKLFDKYVGAKKLGRVNKFEYPNLNSLDIGMGKSGHSAMQGLSHRVSIPIIFFLSLSHCTYVD
jgi:hypothetical protein